MSFTVGTDVGGTFTDLWARADDGRQTVVKVASTADIISGIEDAVVIAAEHFGLPVGEFCAGIERFGHGTTAGLNALLTGRAARTGVLTTEGFGDTLEIGRLKRQVAGLSETEVGDYLNRNRWAPIVPRRLVREVPERIDRTGAVLQPLDEEKARAEIRALGAAGVQAIAVCTLWSVANPVHERRLAELVRGVLPEVFVTLSSEAAPTVGEYARMSTTAANAALGPVVSAYLTDLDQRLHALGLRRPVMVMTGAGGVVTAAEVAVHPVGALMSGPAAGVIVCRDIAEELGHARVLTVDVGGTSFDVSTIVDGAPSMRSQLTLAGADIHYPAIDVGTIGAGGGSIARVRAGGLAVGPDSAGARPGPACYGRGGTLPTATDADLVLGVFAADSFAGDIAVDRVAAERAIREHIASPLGMDLLEAAWGIRAVLDSRMADLLRSVTIERGLDPADFVLFANGGQGPSHAWALCRQLGIRTFVVTPTATVQSALGTGVCDVRQTVQRTAYVRLATGAEPTPAQLGVLRAALGEVSDQVRDRLGAPPTTTVELALTVAVRYRGQAHHLDVAVAERDLDAGALAKTLATFENEYEALYGAGSAFPEAGFELLSVRAIGALPGGGLGTQHTSDPIVLTGHRDVVFDDPAAPVSCPVYRTAFPAPGEHLLGPALVCFPGQTLVVPPGWQAATDERGNVVVTLTTTGGGTA